MKSVMMRYRLLSKEELEPLQEEFLKYLLVANITPDNWKKLKHNNPIESQQHLETFSDLILDKILSGVNYVDVVLTNRVEVYHFMKEQVSMFCLENKVLDTFDFKQTDWSAIDISTAHLIQAKKTYAKERNKEVFDILQKKHAFISNGSLYKRMALISVE